VRGGGGGGGGTGKRTGGVSNAIPDEILGNVELNEAIKGEWAGVGEHLFLRGAKTKLPSGRS
jgi:hypothetical protein